MVLDQQVGLPDSVRALDLALVVRVQRPRLALREEGDEDLEGPVGAGCSRSDERGRGGGGGRANLSFCCRCRTWEATTGGTCKKQPKSAHGSLQQGQLERKLTKTFYGRQELLSSRLREL